MNTQIHALLENRFAAALQFLPHGITLQDSLVRPTTDPQFGDYQANCAMPLAKQLKHSPRDIAAQIVAALEIEDLCEPPEIAGPGFINLRLKSEWIANAATEVLSDPQLGVEKPTAPRRLIIDFSSPNVAKPMHVGHIRSTVIGDALTRVFRFLGHEVITDNHLGDWGTQFGMIIYGYKHFVDKPAFEAAPVAELSRLYRLVNQLIGFHQAVASLPAAKESAAQAKDELRQAESSADAIPEGEAKAFKKTLRKLQAKADAAVRRVEALENEIAQVEEDAQLSNIAPQHKTIASDVLNETVKLHEGDPENKELWDRFLPHCQTEINRIYRLLNVEFDHTLGESFYHPMLPEVVAELRSSGLAKESEGAVCVFLPEFDAPLIVQKQDGAYLYATTDLATLKYRKETFDPTDILYVVDTRQSEHFEKLFALAPRMGLEQINLKHVNFGTVLGEDGRPFKTRSGTSVGLESLLEDAVDRARQVVCDPERVSKLQPPLSEEEKEEIAVKVGYGAIKYADLAHHRTSDYRFSLEKMVSLEGNTSAYVQYAYARTQGILRGGQTSEAEVVRSRPRVTLTQPEERSLAIGLLRFPEALPQVAEDYAPNVLVDYLYDTARRYAVFNDTCHVLKAGAPEVKQSRLALVALTGRVLRTGLNLLGIEVTERM